MEKSKIKKGDILVFPDNIGGGTYKVLNFKMDGLIVIDVDSSVYDELFYSNSLISKSTNITEIERVNRKKLKLWKNIKEIS
jgi:hypothetical protein